MSGQWGRGVAWSILPASGAGSFDEPSTDTPSKAKKRKSEPEPNSIFTKGFEPQKATTQTVATPTKPTLNDLWEQYQNQFLEFLKTGAPPKYKPVSAGSQKDYMNALTKFFNQFRIKDWKDLREALLKRNMPKQLVNGLGRFIGFLSYYEYITPEEEQRWRKGIIRKRSDIKPAERLEKADIEKIKQGYKKLMSMEKISDADKLGNELLFKLMFYSGQRMQHALEILQRLKKDKELLKFEDNIAYMPVDFVSKGKKRSFMAFIPKEFGEYLLKNIDEAKLRSYDTYRARFQDAKVNATAIRTWFSTFLAENKVPMEIINFITGKVPESVLAKHYLNMTKLAKEEYKRIAGKFPEL